MDRGLILVRLVHVGAAADRGMRLASLPDLPLILAGVTMPIGRYV